MLRRHLILPALLGWLITPPGQACEVDAGAAVPVAVLGARMLVNAGVDGHPVLLQLDTGAVWTTLARSVADRLRLPRSAWITMDALGIGGREGGQAIVIRSLTLGGVTLHRKAGDGSLVLMPAADRPPVVNDVAIDGLLGSEFLADADLDLDGPGRTLTVHRVNRCAGRFLPWTIPYDAVPNARIQQNKMFLPVAVNGRALTALIDSGAFASAMNAAGMRALGLTRDDLRFDQVIETVGIGQRKVPLAVHRVSELRIGARTRRDVPLLVGAIPLPDGVEMVLGADWLLQHRVWISHATTQLFVAR